MVRMVRMVPAGMVTVRGGGGGRLAELVVLVSGRMISYRFVEELAVSVLAGEDAGAVTGAAGMDRVSCAAEGGSTVATSAGFVPAGEGLAADDAVVTGFAAGLAEGVLRLGPSAAGLSAVAAGEEVAWEAALPEAVLSLVAGGVAGADSSAGTGVAVVTAGSAGGPERSRNRFSPSRTATRSNAAKMPNWTYFIDRQTPPLLTTLPSSMPFPELAVLLQPLDAFTVN